MTKIFSKEACIFRLFYRTKVTKFVKVTKILSDIVLPDKVFREKRADNFLSAKSNLRH